MHTSKLRVATLNAWALPDPIGSSVAERIHAIGAEIPRVRPDVIAFQEVWTQSARRALTRAGRSAGLQHAWSAKDALGAGGLLLLSRWPLESPRLQRFSLPQLPTRPDHLDYYGRKGFIAVRIALPSGPLHLLTTHLQARYGRHVSHEYRSVRVGQIIELATELDRARDPVVLLGDLNFREIDDEYRVLAGLTQLRDAAAETGWREPTVDSSNPFRKSTASHKRIDYVFIRDGDTSGLRVRALGRAFDERFEIDGRPATFSDHAGLVAELEIHDAPRPPAGPARAAAVLAAEMLATGRERAQRIREDARVAASAGWAAALAASLGCRHRTLSRRRLLRAGLTAAGIAALPPGVGFTMLAEYFAPDELEAYDRLSARLAAVIGETGPHIS
ncbi:MAG: endonuclease/exonuclease/phosphatase family protein [Deltaproteobacteria bacterium]|nr:endonuclease/exonuclease/phosphatase family protein [Deltaproteobacteria bacterium]MBW2361041.1 endonuclease/exonuclease/phosphatase family protein [Deltaproteobacteria bacterium]